jgi:altronate dehydratase
METGYLSGDDRDMVVTTGLIMTGEKTIEEVGKIYQMVQVAGGLETKAEEQEHWELPSRASEAHP